MSAHICCTVVIFVSEHPIHPHCYTGTTQCLQENCVCSSQSTISVGQAAALWMAKHDVVMYLDRIEHYWLCIHNPAFWLQYYNKHSFLSVSYEKFVCVYVKCRLNVVYCLWICAESSSVVYAASWRHSGPQVLHRRCADSTAGWRLRESNQRRVLSLFEYFVHHCYMPSKCHQMSRLNIKLSYCYAVSAVVM